MLASSKHVRLKATKLGGLFVTAAKLTNTPNRISFLHVAVTLVKITFIVVYKGCPETNSAVVNITKTVT